MLPCLLHQVGLVSVSERITSHTKQRTARLTKNQSSMRTLKLNERNMITQSEKVTKKVLRLFPLIEYTENISWLWAQNKKGAQNKLTYHNKKMCYKKYYLFSLSSMIHKTDCWYPIKNIVKKIQSFKKNIFYSSAHVSRNVPFLTNILSTTHSLQSIAFRSNKITFAHVYTERYWFQGGKCLVLACPWAIFTTSLPNWQFDWKLLNWLCDGDGHGWSESDHWLHSPFFTNLKLTRACATTFSIIIKVKNLHCSRNRILE